MIDELRQIDISAVEALQALRQDQRRLEDLTARALERRSAVTAAIFEKVTADYAGRLQEVEAAARPLRGRARAELAKLLTLHERLEKALAQARLDKEELEFRRELGELEEATFAANQQTVTEAVARSEADFADAEQLKALFLDVLPAAEIPEPAAPAAAAAPPEAPTAPPPAPRLPAPPVPEPPPVPAAPPPPSPPPPPVAAPKATRSGTESTLVLDGPPPFEQTLPVSGPTVSDATIVGGAALPAAPPAAEGTLMVRWARLVGGAADGAEEVHALGPSATIGRTRQNDIVIEQADISRRHARITLGPQGYVIRDLKSNNGTWVNGERVEECLLKDGDQIQVGNRTYRFESR